MTTQKQIIVIGGGPAGIEAARAAARSGAAVTIVSSEAPGGRAGWHSLLPSKVWLNAADTVGLLDHKIGVDGSAQTSPTNIVARIKDVKASWNGRLATDLAALNVTIRSGMATFTGPQTIAIHDKDGNTEDTLTADAFIITSGSVPIFPPAMKPDGKRVIAPRFASVLGTLPQSMVVVGGGATGSEFAYLFNRAGLDVTWIVNEKGILPDFDPAAGQLLGDILAARGVNVVAGQQAQRIDRRDDGVEVVLADGSSHVAEMAFLAIGRKPDVGNLNLEAAGLTVENGTVAVDGYGRTATPHIYLAGDVTGTPMIANRAMAQAWTAGKHAAGAETPPFHENTVVAAIYSEPQVAQVGQWDTEAATVTLPFAANLKATLSPDAEGFVKLAYNQESGALLGAVAIGSHAADVLSPVAVALAAGLTIQQLGQLYVAHPTISELAFAAARQI